MNPKYLGRKMMEQDEIRQAGTSFDGTMSITKQSKAHFALMTNIGMAIRDRGLLGLEVDC